MATATAKPVSKTTTTQSIGGNRPPTVTIQPDVSAPKEVEVKAAPQISQVDPPTVSAAKAFDDLVAVTVFEQIDPPPVVGSFNVGHELGITRMVPKQAYKLPRFVAEVIVDAKKGVIIDV